MHQYLEGVFTICAHTDNNLFTLLNRPQLLIAFWEKNAFKKEHIVLFPAHLQSVN